ncbi:MAG: hypothetical protein KC502_06965 [Myxococcales bacterium]|nr:hypothetical protein [Myxococcales bacterium]
MTRYLTIDVLFACCLVAALWLPPPAAAATPAEMRKAEALATEAKVFFRSKLYKDAALQFMEAFALSQAPSLVYNAARAYEEGKYNKKAIALFRHYLSLPGVDAAGKMAAKKHLTSIEMRVKQAAATAKARDAAVARRLATDKKKRAAQLAARQAAARRTAEAKRRKALLAQRRIDPWWAGTSVGVLVLSGAAYGVAWNLASEMSSNEVVDQASKKRYLTNRDSAVAWRSLAIGAGVIGVGLSAWTAWQWWQSGLPKPAKKKAQALWLAPSWSSGGGGLVLGARF